MAEFLFTNHISFIQLTQILNFCTLHETQSTSCAYIKITFSGLKNKLFEF